MKHQQTAFSNSQRLAAFGELVVDCLSVQIGGRTLLSEVCLDVGIGEVVALLGRDGAGKTSCFEAIVGLTSAHAGRILLNGLDVTELPTDHRARDGLGYLPEEVSIFRGLTVEENILSALESSQPDPLKRIEQLQGLIDDFDLAVVRHQLATSLSGGERRRCEVARAMAMKPTILLLDEPFKGLDPGSIRSTKQVISSLRQRNVGVLISDYDLHDLLEITDRVYVLHSGRMIFSGNTDEFLSSAEVRRLFLGETFSL